jgi:hypothetical protein
MTKLLNKSFNNTCPLNLLRPNKPLHKKCKQLVEIWLEAVENGKERCFAVLQCLFMYNYLELV